MLHLSISWVLLNLSVSNFTSGCRWALSNYPVKKICHFCKKNATNVTNMPDKCYFLIGYTLILEANSMSYYLSSYFLVSYILKESIKILQYIQKNATDVTKVVFINSMLKMCEFCVFYLRYPFLEIILTIFGVFLQWKVLGIVFKIHQGE